MSFEDYADLDKLHTDLLEENFNTKFEFKISGEGPFSTKYTTETEFLPESKILPSNVSVSFKCPYTGIEFNKVELSSFGDHKYEFESTFECQRINGLALGLSGRGNNKTSVSSDLFAAYRHRHGALIAKVNLTDEDESREAVITTSILTNGSGVASRLNAPWLANLVAAATADVLLHCQSGEKKCPIKDFGATLAWTSHDSKCSTVLRASNKFENYGVSVFGRVNDKVSLVAKVGVDSKFSDVSYEVGSVYEPNERVQLKAKVNNDKVISASIAKSFPKNIVLSGAASVDCNDLSCAGTKFGFSAVIG